MASGRRSFVPWYDADTLERRDLLSGMPVHVVMTHEIAHLDRHAEIHAPRFDSPGVPRNLFHSNGANGLKLSPPFVNQLNTRLAISGGTTQLVNQAFQVFGQNALGQTANLTTPVSTRLFPYGANSSITPQPLPPGVKVGATPASTALPALVATLNQQLQYALTTFYTTNPDLTPSQQTAPKFSPLADEVLVPYAQQQVADMNAQLTPAPGGGAVVDQQAIKAWNTAYANILNAVAEFSIHPNLFRNSSDFYSNPNVQFTTNYNAVPAQAGPGYFVRGPGGHFLPGAILHPHKPS